MEFFNFKINKTEKKLTIYLIEIILNELNLNRLVSKIDISHTQL